MVNRPAAKSMRGWQAIGRSVRGAAHVRESLPNQDALALSNAEAGVLVAAVADGHGGARHCRSADGARMAVQASAQVLRELAPRFDAARGEERARLAAVEVPPRIVAAWVDAARSDLATRPIDLAELGAIEAAEGGEAAGSVRDDPLLAYGATLLTVLLTPSCIVLFQLGDGDVLAVASDGSTTRPVPRDERLGGNVTTSICRAGAEADFRSMVLDRERARPALVLMSTDGYANSFRTDADYLQVGRDFLALIREHGLATVEGKLDEILAHASQHGSGDDITLALLYDADSALPVHAARTAVPAAPDAQPEPALATPHADPLRLAMGLLAAVVVGAAAWTLREHWLPRLAGSNEGPTPTIVAPIVKDPGPVAPASSPTGSATIEKPRAAHLAGSGIEVTASVAVLPVEGAGCTVRTAVFNAADKELGAASYVLVPAKPGAPLVTDVKLLVPYGSDTTKAKALQAPKNLFSLRIDCARETVARTARLPIDS